MSKELKIAKYMRRTRRFSHGFDRIVSRPYRDREIKRKFGEVVHVSPIFFHPYLPPPGLVQVYFVRRGYL